MVPPVSGKGKSSRDDIKLAIEHEKDKNAELQTIINHLKEENSDYKLKYNKLKLQMHDLNTSLEKNVKIFSELFASSKDVLLSSRLSILNSPVRNQTPVVSESPQAGPSAVAVSPILTKNKRRSLTSVLTKSPQAGPSKVTVSPNKRRNIPHRRLHIEPMNMQELQAEIETNDENSGENSGSSKRLTTILEENTSEPSVILSRLPLEVIDLHLKKHSSGYFQSLSHIDESFETKGEPSYASTPFKVETVVEIHPIPTFVSTRKKDSKSKNSRSNGQLSPKKERINSPAKSFSKEFHFGSPLKKENSLTPKNEKKRQQTPEIQEENGRPTRRAKPKVLKEESLRKKKRRN